MPDSDKKRSTNLDAEQGAGEEQTESYQAYEEGALEPATQPSAKSDSGESSSAGLQAEAVRVSLEEAILFAKKYLEDLLSFFGLNTDVHATIDEDVIELQVPSTHLNGFLIGQRGETMRALQFMVSNALKSQGHEVTRVNVDVAAYKKQRAEQLAQKAEEWLKTVKDSGKPMDLVPMNPADRRVVHKVASEAGLLTESVGEGYDRHIVLKPSGSSDED